jgi:hypothetical protein
MKLLKLITIAIILTIVTNEFTFAQHDTTQIEHPPNGHNSPYKIAFTDLISNTQYYDGQQLEVIGYLSLNFESDALWLSKAEYDTGDYKKAIWVSIDERKLKRTMRFNHHYIMVEAVFNRIDNGFYFKNVLNVISLKRWRLKNP